MVFFVIIMKSTFASMSDIVSQKVIQYKIATILYFYFIFILFSSEMNTISTWSFFVSKAALSKSKPLI